MRIGIITWKEAGWCSTQLREAMERKNIQPIIFSFRQLLARVKHKPHASLGKLGVLENLNALLIRSIGRGSLEEIIFRMDLLHRFEHFEMLVINPPSSIERSVDKYYSLSLLEDKEIPVPRTAVTESPEEAMKSFHDLGGDVVVKPLFGSRGVGSTRVSDQDIAIRVFSAISFYRGVIYLQEFIPHGFSDIRAFVIGDHVVAAIRRIAKNWKTNVSLGAEPVSIKLNEEMKALAIKSAQAIGCKIAGVDILEGPEGPCIIELNSQPGWRGLQSVAKTCIADEIVQYVLNTLKS